MDSIEVISSIQPMETRKTLSRIRRGFTIIELVLVIAILGLISGVVIANLGGIFGGTQEDAAELMVSTTFKTPLLKYRIDMGGYPTTAEGLKALIEAPSQRTHLWKGPYSDEVPVDPWQTPFKYVYPGIKNPSGYDLYSAGPDRQFDTADDIGNWKESS